MEAKEKNYANVHAWIRANHGVAKKCENPNCFGKSKNYEWALIKGNLYEKKIKNFIQLCCSCHRKYDVTEYQRLFMKIVGKKRFTENNPMKLSVNRIKASEWMKNRTVSESTREKMSISKTGILTSEETKRKLSIQRQGKLNPASKILLDTQTGIYYETISDAAKYNSLKRSTLSAMLIGQNQNKTNLIYA